MIAQAKPLFIRFNVALQSNPYGHPSMSKKGDYYDNAAMENWNHRFKVEPVHGERFQTRSNAKYQVFEYIEVYYNRKKLHSKLGYISPEAFEAKKVA